MRTFLFAILAVLLASCTSKTTPEVVHDTTVVVDTVRLPTSPQAPKPDPKPVAKPAPVAPADTMRAPAGEPTSADATALVREYYDAINAHEYERAWRMWGNNGAASGKTLRAFTDGFAETASSHVAIGTPGRVEGAAGSRFITIPVTLSAERVDGTPERFNGTFTLRRAVVDGATAGERAWHIESARLKKGATGR